MTELGVPEDKSLVPVVTGLRLIKGIKVKACSSGESVDVFGFINRVEE